MTKERIIYFAGSIRGGRDDREFYLEIIKQLAGYGSVLTEHIGDEGLGLDGDLMTNRQIHNRDVDWLRSSDCLVAEVTIPSLGVGYEIGKASEWGKPVLCLYRQGNGRLLSAMIAGCPDVTLREYKSLSALQKIFDDFFCGL